MALKPEFAKMLGYLAHLNEPLSSDLRVSIDQLKLAHDRFLRNSDNLQEVCFWGKAVVSCLFAHMDALGYAARKCAVLFRSLGGLDLTTKELAKLSEVRYDAQTQTLTRTPELLSPLDSFKLGVRYFSALLGADFKLAVGDERWRGVLDLWQARRRFTHPKRIEDLYAVEMFGGLQSSLIWHYGELMRWFTACSASAGLPVQAFDKDALHAKRIRPIVVQPPPMFDESEFKEKIERVGSRSIAYATHFFKLLRYDSERARLVRKRAWEKRTDRKAAVAFAGRLMLRTECTQIEAINNAARFQLKAARRRLEITFSDDELAPAPDYPKSVGELVSAANLWSQKLGRGNTLTLSDEYVRNLVAAWNHRDRLIHPQRPEDLEMDELETLNFELALLELQRGAHECIEIDADKWVQAAATGGQREE
jgi:hypothetical protein